MTIKTDFKTLCHPYHSFNILFSLSYFVAKNVEPLHNLIFPVEASTVFNSRESDILFCLMVIIAFRTRRIGARSAVAYISTATYYAKACNVLLWFSVDPAKGIIYLFLIIVHFLLVGEPVYLGSEDVTYFQGCQALDEALDTNDGTVWLITFYAPWATPCAALAPVFSKLSLDYGLENLRFGKIDVGKYADVAQKYHINISALSVQLPTLAIYKDGKLLMRKPTVDNKKLQKFFFTEDNIRAAYDLNNLHLECKRRLSDKKSSKSKKE